MKQKCYTIIKWTLIVVLVCAFAFFVIYNAKNNTDFWDASAVNIITIIIAVVISYFFVQRKSDKRKQKDILLDLISKLQLQVSDEKAFDFTGQTREEILMRNRDISNKINILNEVKDIFSIQEEMDFICKEIEEYLNLIGNHSTDLEYLIKSKQELERPLTLISNKLFEMSINLYK